MDNSGTHKHPAVKAWFARHPKYVPYFTPTSSAWLNQVERYYAQITERRIRRGVFRIVEELEAAVEEYLATHNAKPKPFVWTEGLRAADTAGETRNGLLTQDTC